MTAECRELLCEVLPYVRGQRPDLEQRINALMRKDVATDGEGCGRFKPEPDCRCPECRDARKCGPEVSTEVLW